jgi:hypothetical protein
MYYLNEKLPDLYCGAGGMYLSVKGFNDHIEGHSLCHESATISQQTATPVIVGLFAGRT